MTVEDWLTRQYAGGSETRISTQPNLQVRISGESVVISPVDDRVNGSEYNYVVSLQNGTRQYESTWTTVRLGSESYAFVVFMLANN